MIQEEVNSMSKFVEFERPPVVEVILGVLFGTPLPLKVAHVGLFWNKVRKEFVRAEEAPPLLPVMERQDSSLLQEPFQFDPTPRIWLLNGDGNMLIQIQRDRFLFNWKRTEREAFYPFYDRISEKFEELLGLFSKFLKDEKLGDIAFRQFELTYVNHIDTVCHSSDVGQDFLVDHVKDRDLDRFLPDPDGYNWKTSYPLPAQGGRLHVGAQLVLLPPEMNRVTQLEMTARGMSKGTSEKERKVWFDMAHEWIVKGFMDVTSQKWQEKWGKKS